LKEFLACAIDNRIVIQPDDEAKVGKEKRITQFKFFRPLPAGGRGSK
jgi:hypothetical protein